MKVWFMYDNHTFRHLGDGTTPIVQLQAKALECFTEDGCGSVFARTRDDAHIGSVGGKRFHDGWRPDNKEWRAFWKRVEEHQNWEARG